MPQPNEKGAGFTPGPLPDFKSKAFNLRCAAATARDDDATIRTIFAPKIAVTCEITADWIEALEPTFSELCSALADMMDAHKGAPSSGKIKHAAWLRARAALSRATPVVKD